MASLVIGLIMLSSMTVLPTINAQVTKDHNYYLQQYITLHGQLDQIITQTSDMEKQMSDLKATNAQSNAVKISQLQQQIDENKSKRQSMINELDHIQDESRALFQVDPVTKKKLDDAQAILAQMYLNRTSETYVGDNPIQEIMANYEYKNLWISFDPDKTINSPTGDGSQTIIANIQKVSGNIPLSVDYTKIEPVYCTTRTQQCSPLIAGTNVQASGKTFDCSEGYQANDNTGATGFIMAGHCAYNGNTVSQPPPSYPGTRQVGTVTLLCNDNDVTCDFAFVKATASMSTWIFKDGNSFYVMYDKTPQSSQHPGDIVIKSGITSNIQTGTVTSYDPTTHLTKAQIYTIGGDSGAPIFKDIDGTNEHMYGVTVTHTTDNVYGFYYAPDYVKTKLGLQN